MATAHPTEIRYLEDRGILALTFSDDYEVELGTAFLRGFCPCARCQGHGGGPPRWVPLPAASSARVENVTQVGNYAFCVVWGDGHDTGIYTFRLLRHLVMPGDFDAATLEAGTPLELPV